MAHINLMPWREAHKQKQKQQYLSILMGVALAMLALTYGIGALIDQFIANQNQRNRYIEQQITVLDDQISKIKDIKERKKEIEQRMALIEQLQTSRNVAPRIIDELVRIVPPGVAFRTLGRSNNRISIEGVSESNNRLADFMRRLENSNVFVRPELSSIVADTSSSNAISDFKITFSISPAVAPEVLQLSTEPSNEV